MWTLDLAAQIRTSDVLQSFISSLVHYGPSSSESSACDQIKRTHEPASVRPAKLSRSPLPPRSLLGPATSKLVLSLQHQLHFDHPLHRARVLVGLFDSGLRRRATDSKPACERPTMARLGGDGLLFFFTSPTQPADIFSARIAVGAPKEGLTKTTLPHDAPLCRRLLALPTSKQNQDHQRRIGLEQLLRGAKVHHELVECFLRRRATYPPTAWERARLANLA